MKIKFATNRAEVEACATAIRLLRTHLSEEEIIDRVLAQQASDGFQLLYVEENQKGVCFLGFRTLNMLYSGKTLYIDDLATLPEAQGKGYAGLLLDYIIEYAKRNGYETVSLDSGCSEARYDAHRLYLNKRFNITSHHFMISLKK